MLWLFAFLGQIANAYDKVCVLLAQLKDYFHTHTNILKSTFTFFIENFKKWWCAAFNLRWSGSIKSARPWVPERVSHLIFSRTFCTIEKRGNSGNAQRKTFFFQEVFPRGGWLRISNAELMRCVLLLVCFNMILTNYKEQLIFCWMKINY